MDGDEFSADELSEAIVPLIGERALALFSLAIVEERGAGAATLHWRNELSSRGDDVEGQPPVTEAEQLLIEWGSVMATADEIDELFRERLERAFSPVLRGLLAAYGERLRRSAVDD